jgi:hypothetical protein
MIWPEFICNMDQTAVYLEPKLNKTVSKKGSKTVAARGSGGSHRMTVCLAVTASGHKLPPFIIVKASPQARVEANLQDLPGGMAGCCQEEAWMDEQNIIVWLKKIWMPYAAQVNNSMLLLDNFKCHMHRWEIKTWRWMHPWREPC